MDRRLIVAQGTPGDLKARVRGARRIIVTTKDALNGRSAGIERSLSRLSAVRSIATEVTESGGSQVTVLCHDTAQTLDATLALLRRHGAPIDGVRVIEPTLSA